LHIALEYENYLMAMKLVELGADVNAVGDCGFSPGYLSLISYYFIATNKKGTRS